MPGIVYLKNATVSATLGLDCWHREKSQPVLISLQMHTSVKLAGEHDNVLETIDYGVVYESVAKAMDSSSWSTLESFATEACRIGMKSGGGSHVKASVLLPKALLQAEGVGFECAMKKQCGDEEFITSQIRAITSSQT